MTHLSFLTPGAYPGSRSCRESATYFLKESECCDLKLTRIIDPHGLTLQQIIIKVNVILQNCVDLLKKEKANDKRSKTDFPQT